MELVSFSLTNFRSITSAHKISLSKTTVLIGKNNEGKSNILKGLNIAMSTLQMHGKNNVTLSSRYQANNRYARSDESLYFWGRDFPIKFQSRKSGLQSIFKLEFILTEEEIELFRSKVKSNINGSLPIEIRIGKDNEPIIKVVQKRGPGSKALNLKSSKIANFIGKHIVFNYIPAVRTDQEAMGVVRRMLSRRLRQLERQDEYMAAIETIKKIQEPILKELGNQIKEPLKEFLPSIESVDILISDDVRRTSLRNDFEIIIDDGTPTSLFYKGDGVKSLAALGLLKHRESEIGASIIAIEEPESHLHPAAIHQLNSIISTLGENNQVVITTHNPLFVDRNDIKSNIIVNNGKALPAKNISDIRELLGIKASDNLVNASYVLVVEGADDVITLRAILSSLSEKISKALQSNLLVIDEIGGAGNLSYKLILLGNSLCVYHTFLDNDDAGRNAYNKAIAENLLLVKNNTFVTCNGSPNSELEDCLNPHSYEESIHEQFGVSIASSAFRGNKKWSDRMKNVFLDQGKLWDQKTESEVKYSVANAINKNPFNSLNEHKRNSIDALVVSLETLIKS